MDGSPFFQLAQYYLIHLLREKLTTSNSRIVFVSSGAIRNVTDLSTLEDMVKAQSGASFFQLYPATKFIQLLGAHWWRRQLKEHCDVLAVSPGSYLCSIRGYFADGGN
jgi:NAD(P)-dependent dehydrogenase (short-subunit alcohol dehydrogenase family)